MDRSITALMNIGLSKKEAKVYVALLSSGKSPVSTIAEKSGIKRPTAYVILDELRKKEYVLKMPRGKQTMYLAKSPEEIYGKAEAALAESRSVLPELKALERTDTKANTLYFDGMRGVEEALYYRADELHDSEILAFFAKTDQMNKKFITLSHKWRTAMHKQDVTLRGIAPDHPSLKEFRKTDSAVGHLIKSVLPEEYSSNVSVDVTDLFVRIVLFDTPQAIIIESSSLVQTVREIFEMVWKGRN